MTLQNSEKIWKQFGRTKQRTKAAHLRRQEKKGQKESSVHVRQAQRETKEQQGNQTEHLQNADISRLDWVLDIFVTREE